MPKAKIGTYRSKTAIVKRPDIQARMSGPENPAWKGGISAGANRLPYQRARKQRLRETNLAYLRELKSKTPCTDCGRKYHYAVMDFDHLDPKQKTNIVRYFRNFSIERMKQEIAKCELVCANCHRVRTYTRLMQVEAANDNEYASRAQGLT